MVDALRELIQQFKGIKCSYYEKKVNPFCSHGDECFHCAIIPELMFIYCKEETKFHVVFMYKGYYFSGSLRVPRTIDFDLTKLTWGNVCTSYVFGPFETRFINLQKKLKSRLKLYKKLQELHSNDLVEDERLFLNGLINDLTTIVSFDIKKILSYEKRQKLKNYKIDAFRNNLNTEEFNKLVQRFSLRNV